MITGVNVTLCRIHFLVNIWREKNVAVVIDTNV